MTEPPPARPDQPSQRRDEPAARPDQPGQRPDEPAERPDETRVESRAELLPEEETAGSEDREQQARAILEESDERTDHPQETRHASHQTPG